MGNGKAKLAVEQNIKDFGKFNTTPFVGLENTVPGADFSNAVLQMLYFIPEVRAVMLGEQYNIESTASTEAGGAAGGVAGGDGAHSSSLDIMGGGAGSLGMDDEAGGLAPPSVAEQRERQKKNDGSLPSELGFLFHMLDQAKFGPSKHRVCHSANFLRAFQQLSEVPALGLLTGLEQVRG